MAGFCILRQLSFMKNREVPLVWDMSVLRVLRFPPKQKPLERKHPVPTRMICRRWIACFVIVVKKNSVVNRFLFSFFSTINPEFCLTEWRIKLSFRKLGLMRKLSVCRTWLFYLVIRYFVNTYFQKNDISNLTVFSFQVKNMSSNITIVCRSIAPFNLDWSIYNT